MLLFLDLGKHTGFAVGPIPDYVPIALEASSKPIPKPYSGVKKIGLEECTNGQFFCSFVGFLGDLLQVHKSSIVYFEAPVVRNVTAVERLFGLSAHTQSVCHARGIRQCYPANIQQVKKFFAGTGRAEKADMVAAARRRGRDVEDHNHADALAGWCWAVSDILAKQRKVA